MQLDGIHHITCITADAPGNVDFYARVLGMRFVKKTVNFDAPDVYHLYYGDERGAPGSILTFFEFPGAAPGRAGAGMIHRLRWRVGSDAALQFWSERLAHEGVEPRRDEHDRRSLRFPDPEGMDLELAVVESDDEPLVAEAEGIPAEYALLGFDGVRAYSRAADQEERTLTEVLGFTMVSPGSYVLEGGRRHATYAYDEPPPRRWLPGRGHRAPHRLVRPRSGPPGVAGALAASRRARHPDHRPPVLLQHLLPRAPRRALRAGDSQSRFRDRRGSRAPGRGAAPAPAARASTRAAGAVAYAACQSASEDGPVPVIEQEQMCLRRDSPQQS